MRQLEQVEAQVRDLTEIPAGKLKLSVTVAFGEYCVVPLLPNFSVQYPDIEIDLDVTDRLVNLNEEHLDLCIRIGRLEDSNLVVRRLHQNDFVLCASPDYLGEYGKPKSVSALSSHTWLRFTRNRWQQVFYEDRHARPQKLKIFAKIAVNSARSLRQLTLAGTGLALLPIWIVAEDLARERLIRLLPRTRFSAYDRGDSGIYALYPERRYLANKVRLLLDFLTANIEA